jgi:hypothetical protein
MSFLATIKGKTGNELYAHLVKEAEKEVAAAMQMPLKDQYRHDQYYQPKFFRLTNLISECQRFEALGLKISPADVIDVLFKCKLLFAAQDEDEYMKRIGGGMKNFGLWRDKSNGAVVRIISARPKAPSPLPLCRRTPRRFAPFGRRSSTRQRLGLRLPSAAFPRIAVNMQLVAVNAEFCAVNEQVCAGNATFCVGAR